MRRFLILCLEKGKRILRVDAGKLSFFDRKVFIDDSYTEIDDAICFICQKSKSQKIMYQNKEYLIVGSIFLVFLAIILSEV
jgi:hypothetical protein